MRQIAAVLFSSFSVMAAQATECELEGFCAPLMSTRGDLIFYPVSDQRPFHMYEYGDAARMEQCVILGAQRGLQVSPETCIRVGGFLTTGFSALETWPGTDGRSGKFGEAHISFVASSQTEVGEMVSVFTHKAGYDQIFASGQNGFIRIRDEIYHSIAGFTAGYTYSLWDLGGPRGYSDGSTFSWYGSRSHGSPADDIFMTPLVRYVSSFGPIGYGLSVEGLEHLPYDYIRISDSNIAVVVVLTLDTSWGGMWVKGAYDAAVHEFSAKAGVHWDLVPGKSTARLLVGLSNGVSVYGEHHFGFWTVPGDWSIIGAYKHSLTDTLAASIALGVYGRDDQQTWTSELSVAWKLSDTGEVRVEGASWHDPSLTATTLLGSVRFTRFF